MKGLEMAYQVRQMLDNSKLQNQGVPSPLRIVYHLITIFPRHMCTRHALHRRYVHAQISEIFGLIFRYRNAPQEVISIMPTLSLQASLTEMTTRITPSPLRAWIVRSIILLFMQVSMSTWTSTLVRPSQADRKNYGVLGNPANMDLFQKSPPNQRAEQYGLLFLWQSSDRRKNVENGVASSETRWYY